MITKVEKNSKRGAKAGERRGGRKKGTPNKKTAAVVNAAKAKGILPLDYMLLLMRRPIPAKTKMADRIVMENMKFEAAKAAAPYIHPKLSAIEHTGADGEPLNLNLTVVFGK